MATVRALQGVSMRNWSISGRGVPGVEVESENWLVALGRGLAHLGRVDALRRLACEVLPNGTVIARDVGTGQGYVVQEVGAEPHAADVEAFEVEPLELGDDEPRVEPPAVERRRLACEAALDLAREGTGAEGGAVILERRGMLVFVAATGPRADRLVGVRLPLGTGVAGYAMQNRRTVVLADAAGDPLHCGDIDALTGYATRELLAVPVAHGEAVLGVLELMNLPDGRRFLEPDVERALAAATALAEQLAAR